ncbi:MAG TPA: hypothetical protein VES60_01760, partial [Nakamurella sp.]|nr:hypothetical protein [Nakamurella sp.]
MEHSRMLATQKAPKQGTTGPGPTPASTIRKAGLTASDRAAAAELRRRHIRVIDIRPTHTETGLASRPIAGQSPRLPAGGSPE